VASRKAADALRYRRFGTKDVAAAHKLSLAVRWPHRIEDWEFARRLGTGHVAEESRGLVGTVLSWKFGPRHAALGMVIVDPQWQGRGVGRELMARALADLGDRTVLLHATPAGQGLYARLGFAPVGKVDQHQGTARNVPPASLSRGERLRPVGRSDAAKLSALAARATGMSRSNAIAALLAAAEGIVLDRNGEPIGFALIRRFGKGQLVGPVVAPDVGRAKALIGHWIASSARQFLRIDVGSGSGLGEWLASLGLPKVDTVVVMVRGKPPHPDAGLRQYAIANQALG